MMNVHHQNRSCSHVMVEAVRVPATITSPGCNTSSSAVRAINRRLWWTKYSKYLSIVQAIFIGDVAESLPASANHNQNIRHFLQLLSSFALRFLQHAKSLKHRIVHTLSNVDRVLSCQKPPGRIYERQRRSHVYQPLFLLWQAASPSCSDWPGLPLLRSVFATTYRPGCLSSFPV